MASGFYSNMCIFYSSICGGERLLTTLDKSAKTAPFGIFETSCFQRTGLIPTAVTQGTSDGRLADSLAYKLTDAIVGRLCAGGFS
jgi:hypothetical protein